MKFLLFVMLSLAVSAPLNRVSRRGQNASQPQLSLAETGSEEEEYKKEKSKCETKGEQFVDGDCCAIAAIKEEDKLEGEGTNDFDVDDGICCQHGDYDADTEECPPEKALTNNPAGELMGKGGIPCSAYTEVKSKADCEALAKKMGLCDKNASETRSSKYPKGCFYRDPDSISCEKKLWFNSISFSRYTGSSRQALCSRDKCMDSVTPCQQRYNDDMAAALSGDGVEQIVDHGAMCTAFTKYFVCLEFALCSGERMDEMKIGYDDMNGACRDMYAHHNCPGGCTPTPQAEIDCLVKHEHKGDTLSMDGAHYSAQTKYTYTVKIGESITQEEQNGYGSWSLGKFVSRSGNKEYYTGGTACHNAGGRNSTIEYFFGGEDEHGELLYVAEKENPLADNNSMCNYYFKINLPMCQTASQLQLSLAEETDPCDCKDEWVFEGKTKYGCNDKDEDVYPWCYVEGDEKCQNAIRSTSTPGLYYKHC